MQVPLQITFRNMESSPLVQEWIEEQVVRLDSFYRPIMGCRVAVELPHRHHRKGAQYHIRIDLTLPGGEVVIKHQPNLRTRAALEGKAKTTKNLEVGAPHKNLRQAIDDAFKAAARRLQDYARRQSGRVKTHEALPVARVRSLLPDEDYGFLVTPDGREIYFHRDSVLNRGFARLKVGTIVSFVEEKGEKGPQASTVRIAGKPSTRRAVRAAAASAS
ncbi:MAG: HPF/RaiA family ribosome-associated protein [Candidatus Acidiferrales bacterium]